MAVRTTRRRIGGSSASPSARLSQAATNKPAVHSSPTRSASKLHAFGNGSNEVQLGRPNDWKDVFQRLLLLVNKTISQFCSSYVTGYLASAIWGLLRGNAVAGRGVRWGLEFGSISAIFGGCNECARLLFNAKQDSLWNVVIRNVLLALFFARSRGFVSMAQNAFLYGGLTYFFVSGKQKRDEEMGTGSTASTVNSVFGATGGGVQPMSMQDLLQQIQKNRSANGGSAGRSPPSSSSPQPSKKSTSKPKDVVDVEWERADTINDDDNNDSKL